jgi:hypothetical protein
MKGMAEATGRYLMFLDDDDVYRRGAFRHVREAVRANPRRVVIFRMKCHDHVLWERPVVEEGQVGTPMFVVPNVPGALGSWLTGRIASDYTFISDTVQLLGEPIWDRQVICTVKPLIWRDPMPWLRVRWDFWRARVAIRTRLRRLRSRLRASPKQRAAFHGRGR